MLLQGLRVQGNLAMTNFMYMFKYLDDALLSGWSFEAKGPTCELGGLRPAAPLIREKEEEEEGVEPGCWRERLRFGVWVVFNARFMGTQWAANKPARLRSSVPKGRVPGRWEFVAWNAGVLLAWKISSRFIDAWLLRPDSDNPFTVAVSLVMGDGWVTERVGRVLSVYVVLYFHIDSIYRVGALVCVALGFTDVEGWFRISLFGSPVDARGVRLFWGRFWHQQARRFNSAIANLIVYHVLRLPRGSLAVTYVFTLLVFASSGLWHLVGNFTSGISTSQSGAMYYFCIQALGIMLEDAFQALVFPSSGKNGREQREQQQQSLLVRAAGHLWLIAWLTWTTPPWCDPILAERKRRLYPG
ncbi:membrane bound O-acyl transferase family-domain-containing protein [Cladorrhinum sp. PSN259]|nr:membrane bound O-acyl transferase family-domain-containing protein [Cladorrhinum sp. PSN259]